jgi:tetratricopeptide (TPR) repeat protein
LSRLGQFATLLEHYELANEKLERLIAMRPAVRASIEPVICRNLFYLGRYSEARKRLRQVCREIGDRPEVAAIHAFVLTRRGRSGLAIERLKAALQHYPRNPQLWGELARHYALAGRWDDADAIFDGQGAEAGGLDRHVLTGKAFVAIERRDYHAAIDLLGRSVVGRSPTGEECRLFALAHLSLRNIDETKHFLALGARGERRSRRVLRKSLNLSQSLHGQLVDEYLLDSENLARIGAVATSRPSFTDATDMLREAASAPDSTLLAISALIALRQAGLLSGSGGGGGACRIPARIIQFWDSDTPRDLRPLMQSWKRHNPSWHYQLFDARSGLLYLRANFDAAIAVAFEAAREPAAQADLFRLAFLFREGGLYADCDDLCVRSFDPLLSDGVEFFGYQEDIGSVANNVLAAAPRNSIVGLALDQAVQAILRGDADMPWLCTGPGLLSRAVVQGLGGLGDVWPPHANIRLLERHEIAAYAASHCHSSYKITKNHWTRKLFG